MTYYNLFEWTVLVVFLFALGLSIKYRFWVALFVLLESVSSILIGEYINAVITRTTSYSESFSYYIEAIELPLSIVLGGMVYCFLMYLIVRILSSPWRWRLAVEICAFLALSALFPLVEILGIVFHLWHWNQHGDIGLGWCLGVWKFYCLFLGTPVITGIILARCFPRGATEGDVVVASLKRLFGLGGRNRVQDSSSD